MSRLVAIISLMCGIGWLVSFSRDSGQIQVDAGLLQPVIEPSQRKVRITPLALPLRNPVHLDDVVGEGIQVTVSGKGADYVATVEILGTGHINVDSVSGSRVRGVECGPQTATATFTSCAFAITLSRNDPASVVISGSAATTITKIDVRVAAARQLASASNAALLKGFGILLLLGPLQVWLRRRAPWIDRYVLIGTGLAWIAYAGLSSLIADLAFLLAGYALFRWISRRRDGSFSALLAVLVAVGSGLFFVKFAAPALAGAFASSGAYFALPLGISYFAIRIADLLISGYSGVLRSVEFQDYAAFLLMPHTLPAGPILTYRDYLGCRAPSYGFADFAAGGARFFVGLTKKLAADSLLLPAIQRIMVSFLEHGRGDTPFYIAAMLSMNTLYVYLDFSAYSDLAIGTGRAGGYRIPENFDWPLFQPSLRRFWQHWHMTLTNWVMRRLYFPAFLSSRSITLSMIASMLVIAMWHDPTLSWVMWAFHHALPMSIEAKLAPAKSLKHSTAPPKSWQRLRQALGVAFVWSWVSLGHSFTMFSSPSVALRCYAEALRLPMFAIGKALEALK